MRKSFLHPSDLEPGDSVRALSLWEPWASLMATGAKSIETRHWPTDYRGPLLICASKHRVLCDLWDDLDCSSFQQGLETLFKENRRVLPEDLNFGHAVALVDLVDCVPTGILQGRGQARTDAPFGNFGPAHALWPIAIPLIGKLGGLATALFVGLGVSIIALSFREFARAGTSLRPDRGARALIQSGSFGYSRNPLYVAVILLLLGAGVWVNSAWIWLSCALLVPVMNRLVISREERHLESQFGQVYLEYKKTVRRWL